MHDFYITINNGLLKNGHRKRMGSAVWEFMWLLDKVTSVSEDGIGLVLGGKPIKLKEIAKDLEIAENNVSQNLIKLEEEGYVKTIRAPYGLIIKIYKTKKVFNQKRDSMKTENLQKRRINEKIETTNEIIESPNEIIESNKDKTVDKTVDKTNTIVDAIAIADSSGQEVNRFLGMFESLNPEYQRFYSNKTQRTAMQDLIEKYNPQKLEEMLQQLPAIVQQPYAPIITSPLALRDKMANLMLFMKRHSEAKGGVADGRGIV